MSLSKTFNQAAEPNAADVKKQLIAAIKAQDGDVVSAILQSRKGAAKWMDDGGSMLHIAVEARAADLITVIAKAGAPLEHLNRHGQTALMRAAIYNDTASMENLIASGAKIETQGSGAYTALHYACSGDHDSGFDAATLLLKKNANVYMMNNNKDTPLHLAVEKDSPKTAKALLDKGASIEAENKDHFTPLLSAARYQSLSCARILIAKDANTRAKDFDDETVLGLCEIYGDEDGLFLSEMKALIKAHNDDKKNAVVRPFFEGTKKPVQVGKKLRLRSKKNGG